MFLKKGRTKGEQGMDKTSQLTEIQDEANMGKDGIPMAHCMGLNCAELVPLDQSYCPKCLPIKRCLGLGCEEKVPFGTYFCPACTIKKNSIRRVKEVSNGGRNSRVMIGQNSTREI